MKAESRINQWKWLTISFGVLVLEAGVIFYYIWQQLGVGKIILIGNIAAVFQYLQLISKTYMDIAENYQRIIAWKTDYETAEPIKNALAKASLRTEDRNNWHQIRISGLNFDYQDGKKTLQDIGLSFSRGDKIALVGESGSGKSSLMAILRGLYEPGSVRLDLDGQQFDMLSPLFEKTTLIPQEPEIFENTIGYNITFDIEYPEEDITDAVRLACFDRVLERMPNGFATDVREKGVTLSGGERQRLALARGIIAAKDSSIILMDEPTSSVDMHNEMAIYDNIFRHFSGCTVIASVHRLHLLNRFDQIIVIDHGKITQAGSFEELKNTPGLFQSLWDKYQKSSKP